MTKRNYYIACPTFDLECPYCSRDGECGIENPERECDEMGEFTNEDMADYRHLRTNWEDSEDDKSIYKTEPKILTETITCPHCGSIDVQWDGETVTFHEDGFRGYALWVCPHCGYEFYVKYAAIDTES